MSDQHENHDDVTAGNIERLLSTAYRPEGPDHAFVERASAAMVAAARPAPAPFRLWPRLALAASILVLMGLGVAILMRLGQQTVRRDGDLVWVDGKAYVPKDGKLVPVPSTAVVTPVADTGPRPRAGIDGGLTPRQRPAAPTTRAAVGETIATKAGERRRLALADGSVLYLNQKTSITIDGDRRVTVAAGELFVEVAPRQPQQGEAAAGATFVVKAPGREVTALGTKFAVKVESAGTGVLVTQGKVKVSDLGTPIGAGQQLAPDGRAPAPVARATRQLDWTADLIAAAQTPLVPASEYAGGALMAVDPNGQEARLSLRAYHVDVHVEDGFARTTIDQTYFNHLSSRTEGTFFFPLPADASISRLAMYVEGKLMEGGMAERDYARQVYESIVNTRRDPALLEWVDGTTFKMRVFPLEGRQEKRIVISYTQKLPGINGQTDYRFPGGHTLGVVGKWSFHAVVKGGAAMGWACPSHLVMPSVSPDGKDLVLDAEQKAVKVEQDVVLNLYTGPADPKAAAAKPIFAAAELDGRKFLMVRHHPALDVKAARERRDWVVLFEAAGNRDPVVARAQVDVVKTLLENAEHDDTFAILTAGTRTAAFATEAVPATPANVKAAIAFLEKTHLVGALDLGRAMAAAAPFVQSAKNPHLVHVGAGLAALGERREDALVKLVPAGAKYVGVGVGKRWSRAFMKSAAARTGGYAAQINPDENIAWRTLELMATLNTPRLLNVTVTDDSGKVTFLPLADSVSAGEELCAALRLEKGAPLPASVLVSGLLDGKTWSMVLEVAGVIDGAGYLPRTWARLEIDRLLADNAEANKAKIVDLSKSMYVMSPFTSLLVLENEQMYQQFKIDRGRKDHWAMYPCPETIPVVTEPLPGAMPAAAPATPEQPKASKTAEQLLQSIVVRVAPSALAWPDVPNRGITHLTAYQLYTGAWAEGWGPVYDVTDVGFDFDVDYYFDSSDFTRNGTVTRWGESNARRSEIGRMFSKSTRFREGQKLSDREGFRRRSNLRFEDNRRVYRGLRARAKDEVSADGWYYRPLPGVRRLAMLTDGTDRSFVNEWDFADLNGTIDGVNTFNGRSLHANWESSLELQGLTTLQDGRFVTGNIPAARGTIILQGEAELNAFPLLSTRIDGEHAKGAALRAAVPAWSRALYQRPSFANDWRVFTDLLQYAPGMNTSTADVLAVLEREGAPATRPATAGSVDPKARALLAAARASKWRSFTVPATKRQPAYTVHFDGAGRLAIDRVSGDGLRERIVCDGTTLLHLYPDLGVGARRPASRFHLDEVTDVVPFAVASADDLARQFDVRLADDRTVTLVPRGAEQAKDKDGKPVPYATIQLVFDGPRLVERRMTRMPDHKLIARVTYAADGTVTAFDDAGKQVSETKLALADSAAAPDLAPDASALVVLPFPLRSQEHVQNARNLANKNPANYTEEEALEMIAAGLGHNAALARDVWAHRFLARGDRRIGFWTIALAAGNSWNADQTQFEIDGRKYTLDPAAAHPGMALAAYLHQQLRINQNGAGNQDQPAVTGNAFVQRMHVLRDICNEYASGRANSGTPEQRAKALDRGMGVLHDLADPGLGWALLTLTQGSTGDATVHARIAIAAGAFEDVPALAYTARYERARSLRNAHRAPEARALFAELFRTALKAGAIPPLESDFRNAFTTDAQGQQEWATLMREAGKLFGERKARAAAVSLAWACYQLGDQAMADELFAPTLIGLDAGPERFYGTLTGVDYLYRTTQYARADQLLKTLLDDEKYAAMPDLWRLAARLAEHRGMTARSLAALERAMELEFASMPAVVNLQAIRAEYGQLLTRYQQLADAIATLESEPPKDLIAKVIRSADRWRAIDPEPAQACEFASRILQRLGAEDLAWDYMTTPLADKPNEAAPWAALAQSLRAQGDVALADRAYATAFAAEPTNAQILYDHAMLLQQFGRAGEARELFQKLATGDWQQRWDWIKAQAKTYVAR